MYRPLKQIVTRSVHACNKGIIAYIFIIIVTDV